MHLLSVHKVRTKAGERLRRKNSVVMTIAKENLSFDMFVYATVCSGILK